MSKTNRVKFAFFLMTVMSSVSGILTKDDASWLSIQTKDLYPNYFVSVRINSHSEKEIRVYYDEVLAFETFMPSGYSSAFDMSLRQMTDGHRILQAVYQGGIMKECDISNDSSQMLDFVAGFMAPDYKGDEFGDVLEAMSYSNYTRRNILLVYRTIKSIENIKELSTHVDMDYQIEKCQQFLKIATSHVQEEAKSNNITEIYSEILDIKDVNKLSEFNKELLRENDAKVRNVFGHDVKKHSTEPVIRKRSKRASFDFSSVLIFPGTKWCGKGDLAQCYDDLGDDIELDTCCRDHDCCPYVIFPFTSKYGIFNYRFHSLLHCDCDQRFRGCLRQSTSSMANMIGKIYFNILGSKCFEFTETEVCSERSWWGRCLRYENQTIAEVKSQVSFLDKDGHVDYAVIENHTEN